MKDNLLSRSDHKQFYLGFRALLTRSLADVRFSVTLALGRTLWNKFLLKLILFSRTNLGEVVRRVHVIKLGESPLILTRRLSTSCPFAFSISIEVSQTSTQSTYSGDRWRNVKLRSGRAHLLQHSAVCFVFLPVQSDLSRNNIFSLSWYQWRPLVGVAHERKGQSTSQSFISHWIKWFQCSKVKPWDLLYDLMGNSFYDLLEDLGLFALGKLDSAH